jgi:hypothetical protein
MVITQQHKNPDPATEESVLLHTQNNVKQSTAIMSPSSICPRSFPHQDDCLCGTPMGQISAGSQE